MDNSSGIHLASYGSRSRFGEKTCSVFGCKDHSIFTHGVPSQAEIKSKLIDFIFDGNAPTSLPKTCNLFVCKNHFSLDSYENIGMIMPGFEGTWILKRGLGAIMPTIRLSTSSSQQENKHSQGYSTPPMLRAEERDESSTQQDTHNQCYSTPLMLKVEDPDKTDSVSSMRPDHHTYQQYLRSRGGLVGPSEKIVRSVGTQLSRNTLVYRRSQASQTTEATQTRVLTVSVAIGTPVQWKRPPPIQFRKPFKPSKRRGLKQDAHGVFTEPYIPGEPVSTESMLSQASPSINDVPKFIVDEYCLLELFEDCPACGFVCEVKKTIRGTFLAVHQMCLQCNFSRNWKSQRLEAVPSGDPRSCTSDPECSAAAITEIIGFSDEKPSLDEGPSEDPETSVAAITEIIGFSDENDSSDEGSTEEDHNSDSDWDPLQHHNIDGKLADSESDEDAGSEPIADEKHEKDCRKLKLCPECGAFFYSQTHTCENKKPFSCNMCGKRFLSEGHLKAHSKTHEDGYKHVCKYCFSTFGRRSDKLVHEQSHSRARKPYQCPDCPKVFAKMQERSDHLVSHRGPKRHICHVCNMEFSIADQLQRHVAVHTKVKQFVCEVCQRSFTQSTHLKSHMRVHTGEKPYQCQHCDKSFNHNVSLKSHIQRYHGQLPDPGIKVQMKKTSRNELETERDETDEMERSAVDAEEAERSKDTLCNPDDEEEKEKAEKVEKRRHYKSSGRPKGRPKRNAVFTSRSVSEVEKDDANQMDSSTADVEEAKTDEMESSGVDAGEAEQSNTLCIPENGGDEEKKERVGKRKRCTGKPIGRHKKNAMIIPDDANQLKRPIELCFSNEISQGEGHSTDEEQEHDSDPNFEPSKRKEEIERNRQT